MTDDTCLIWKPGKQESTVTKSPQSGSVNKAFPPTRNHFKHTQTNQANSYEVRVELASSVQYKGVHMKDAELIGPSKLELVVAMHVFFHVSILMKTAHFRPVDVS